METKDKVLLCLSGIAIMLVSPFIVVGVVSILPFIGVIGMALSGAVVLCIVCTCLLVVSFTFSRMGLWSAKRLRAKNSVNVIHVGDIVVLVRPDGSINNITAEVEKARAINAPIRAGDIVESKYPATRETIMELWDSGIGADTIAASCHMDLEDVRRVIRRKT